MSQKKKEFVEPAQKARHLAAGPISRWPGPAALAIIAAFTFVAFANSLHGDFVRDDISLIAENPTLHSWTQVPKLLASDYWASVPGMTDELYRPLVMISYVLNYSIAGADPFGYHVLNLLLHTLVAFAVYGLAVRLFVRWECAVLAALLFAVHPIHTEVVDPVTGRADLLSTLGVLSALNWYVDLDRNRGSRRLAAVCSWGSFGIALFSKESAIVLPALLVLYEIYAAADRKRGLVDSARGKIIPLSGYLLIVVVYLIIRWHVLGAMYRPAGGIAFLDNPVAQADWSVRVLNAVIVSGRYLLLFVWPLQLSHDYSYNAIPLATSLGDLRVLRALSLWLVLCVAAVWSYLRGGRFVFFALGYLAITFLPVSNLLVPIGTLMSERLFYMPSVALCLLMGRAWEWGLDRVTWPPSQNLRLAIGYAVALALISVLTARTIARNRDWRSTAALWQAAAQVVPDSAKVHYVLGILDATEDRTIEAGRRFARALEIHPQFPQDDGNFSAFYGAVLLKLRRVDDALPHLKAAAQRNPHRASTHLNLGLAHASKGSWKTAEAAFRKAIALDIKKLTAHKGLIVALREQGRYLEAVAAADNALVVDPNFQDARINKAAALSALGRPDEARAVLRLIESTKSPDARSEN